MVTVDDLVISLTIKETSKLGKLKKQLDSLVGKSGRGVALGFMYLKRGQIFMSRDLKFIKKNIMRLRPSKLPTTMSPKEFKLTVASLLQDLNEFPEDFVDKILKTKGLKTLKEEFGVKTIEKVREKMIKSLDQVKETLSGMWEGVSVLPPHKQEEVVATLHRLFAESLHGREIGLEFWRAIAKFTPEEIWKGRIAEYARAMGAKVAVEKPLFKVKPKALLLEEVQKKLGLPKLTMEDIKKRGETLVFEETKKELDELVKKVYGWAVTATEGARRIDLEINDITKLSEDFDIKIKGLKDIGVELKRIINREDIQQLLDYMELYGPENILLIGEQITDIAIARIKEFGLEKNLLILENIRELEEKHGYAKALSAPDLEEMKKLVGDIDIEKIESAMDLIKEKLGGLGLEDVFEKLFNAILTFKQALKVNPNYVDLPEFTRTTTNELRKIKQLIGQADIKEKKEILDKTTTLINSLKLDMDAEDLKYFWGELESATEDLKVMTISDEKRNEKMFQLSRAITDIKIQEWQVIRDKYTKFPSIIMEGLLDLKEQAQKFQVTNEQQLGKILLRRVDSLIKDVSEYRKELIKEVGRKSTEIPQEQPKTGWG